VIDDAGSRVQLEIVPSGVLPRHVAAVVAARLRDAVQARGMATLAVSGGGTPLTMLDALAQLPVPWAQVHVLQVDERVAPDGDAARNAEGLRAHLLDVAPVPATNAHLVPVGDLDAAEAAATYAGTLAAVAGTPAVLDVVQLGIGDDGHTASLFPGDAVLEVVDRDVAATSAPHHGHGRVTLTYPALARARRRVWMVVGEEKAEAVSRLWQRDPSAPAARLPPERSLLVVDEAAASALPDTVRGT
jgi:6-phosphogluconolactonase